MDQFETSSKSVCGSQGQARSKRHVCFCRKR